MYRKQNCGKSACDKAIHVYRPSARDCLGVVTSVQLNGNSERMMSNDVESICSTSMTDYPESALNL